MWGVTPWSVEMVAQRCGTGVTFEMMGKNPNTFPKLEGVVAEQRKLGYISPQLPATNLLCISAGFHTHIWSRLPNQAVVFQTYIYWALWFILLCGQQGKKTRPPWLASASPSTILISLNNSCRSRGCTPSCRAATSEMWRWLKHRQWKCKSSLCFQASRSSCKDAKHLESCRLCCTSCNTGGPFLVCILISINAESALLNRTIGVSTGLSPYRGKTAH